MTPDDENERGWDGASGYRWTCPLCGKSQTNYLSGDEASAIRALRAHIRVSADSDHGGAQAFPPDVTDDVLANCVGESE